MTIDKNTFCVAPWFQIRNNSFGTFSVCPQIDHEKSEFKGKIQYIWPNDTPNDFFSSEYVKYLRENLNKGNKLPECSKCWRSEKLTSSKSSLRKSLNKTYINDKIINWIPQYFKNKEDYSSDLLLSADITLNNICNFSCITCSPAASSKIYTKWKKNKDAKVVKDLINVNSNDYFEQIDMINKSNEKYNLLNHIIELKPKNLKILGGEPLLDQKNLTYLSSLDKNVKNKINLFFVTNGSKSLVENDRKLQGFKNITYSISLEGISGVQNYIREESNWDIIEKNLIEYRNHNPKKFISIICVVQALNAYHIIDLFSWCKQLNVELNYIILDDPYFMGVESIPPKLREKILDKISIEKNRNFTLSFSELFKEKPYFEKNFKKFREFLYWNDPDKKWKYIFPEWKPYLL